MGKMISLRHVSHTLPARVEPFYDGLVVAIDGIISIDSENMEHLRAAYFRGYQNTPEGKWLNGFQELDTYVSGLTAKSERTKNVEKGSDMRGQPVN